MIRLECTQSSSNKYYEFHTVSTKARITVTAIYGRIGQAGQTVTIYDGVSLHEATQALDKKRTEKEKKGYRIIGESVEEKPVKKNNDDIPIVWAMNAQGYKDEAQLLQLMKDDNYIAQEKLDGMRAIVHITENGLRIFSRSAGVADPTRPLEKTASLPHLASLKFPQLVGTILDCEILSREMDSAQLSGSVHRKEASGDKSVKLFVFDVLQVKNEPQFDNSLAIRLINLRDIEDYIVSPYIVFVPWTNTPTGKAILVRDILAAGGEGIMLKNIRATYEQGGRPSKNWYKVKKQATFDCVVMGFTKGQGKYNERIGALIFGQYLNGELTELGQASGMNDATRNLMSEHPKRFIGKAVEIKGMEFLKSGAIRHPQYISMRDDKNPLDCIYRRDEQ